MDTFQPAVTENLDAVESSQEGAENLEGELVQKEEKIKKPRKRIIYFSIVALLSLVLVLDSAISLGSFGVAQNSISHGCLLFASDTPEVTPLGGCVFVFWGQTSVLIVAFVWLVYSIVLATCRTKIISFMRILDILMVFLAFILSLSLSITLHAGISRTCATRQEACHPTPGGDAALFPADILLISRNSSWVATILLLCIFIWNGALLVFMYLMRSRGKKKTYELGDVISTAETYGDPKEEGK